MCCPGEMVGLCHGRPSVTVGTVASMAHSIAIIGGDGIGPEVTAEALKVVRRREWPRHDRLRPRRRPLPPRRRDPARTTTLAQLRRHDAILLGAVGTPDVPPGVIERGLLLKMRFELDLYINQRPFAGTAPGHDRPHDFVVIRENTEGPYVGEGGCAAQGHPARGGNAGQRQHPDGCRAVRALRVRSGAARERKHVTLVHKTNVLTFAGDLWQRVFDVVAAEFPDVATAYNHVDAACIYFVQDPHRYDVIVTDNLFGDILTDLGGAVSGGIGVASSAEPQPGAHRARACSNRSTVRRPTSSAPARRTRPQRCSARHTCWSSSARRRRRSGPGRMPRTGLGRRPRSATSWLAARG